MHNTRKIMIRRLLSVTLLSLMVSSAFAGGYRVSMQGQRQLAMGHTGVAVIGNAETMFFNPAGMVYLEDKYSFSAGATALVADTKFQNEIYNWTNSTKNVGTPMYFYGSVKLNDWISAGLAVYTPYGSAVDWDKDWQGSHLVNNIDLKAFYFQPTVAFKLSDHFSFGGGPIYVNGSVEFNRNLTRSMTNEEGQRANVTIDAKNVHAWGYTAGFLVSLTEDFRMGLNYRSKIIMEAKDGDANFYDLPAFAQATYKNTTFNANMPLPAELTVGMSYKMDKWLFAFDYNRTYWRAYDALVIDFKDENIATSVNARNYKDSSTYRFGLQYTANDKLSLRAGWYFDESPVQQGYFAPETPRNDSRAYTGGFTYKFGKNFGVDVSLAYLHFSETNSSYDHFIEDGTPVSFGGTYLTSVFSAGLGLSYNF